MESPFSVIKQITIKTLSHILTKMEPKLKKSSVEEYVCTLHVCMSARDVFNWSFQGGGDGFRDKTYAFIFMRLKICPYITLP